MRRLGWNPLIVYVAVFGAVVAAEVARHPPGIRPTGQAAVTGRHVAAVVTDHPELRRIAQRMILR
jgi:hypothetical protein